MIADTRVDEEAVALHQRGLNMLSSFWHESGVEDVGAFAQDAVQVGELTCERLQHAFDAGKVPLNLAKTARLLRVAVPPQ